METATAQAADSIVWLENTQPRLLHLPDGLKRDKDGNVTNPSGDGKTIPPSAPREKDGLPQLTAVDAKYWNRVKSHAQVVVWMKQGMLRVVEREAPNAQDPDTLAKFNAKTALTLIEAETNLRLLKDWRATETRQEIREAVDERVAALSKPLPPLSKK